MGRMTYMIEETEEGLTETLEYLDAVVTTKWTRNNGKASSKGLNMNELLKMAGVSDTKPFDEIRKQMINYTYTFVAIDLSNYLHE